MPPGGVDGRFGAERSGDTLEVVVVARLDVDDVAPHLGLQLVAGARRDEATAIDDRDLVGEPVGLVEVLRGEHDVGARLRQSLDGEPEVVATARVETGGRFVHEQHARRADEAGAEVEPALHATRVRPDQSVAGIGEPELLEHVVGRGARTAAVVPEQASDHAEVLAPRQRRLDRSELSREPDRPADLLRILGDVNAVDVERARVGSQQCGDRADERRLAGTVGAEHREHRPRGRVEVETGERLDVTEPLREAFGLEHQSHGRADYDTDWPTPIKLPSLSRNHAPRSREPFEG